MAEDERLWAEVDRVIAEGHGFTLVRSNVSGRWTAIFTGSRRIGPAQYEVYDAGVGEGDTRAEAISAAFSQRAGMKRYV